MPFCNHNLSFSLYLWCGSSTAGFIKRIPFNEHYISIPEYTGGLRNRFQDSHGTAALFFTSEGLVSKLLSMLVLKLN